MKIKHVYWFASYNLISASTRYRGVYPLNHLLKNTTITNNLVFPDNSFKGIGYFLKVYLRVLFFRKKNSIIVIQRVCSNRFYANALKLLILLRSKNTQYDMDDADYIRTNPKTLHFFLKNCKKVSVGSTELKKYCSKFNKNVFILTSPVIEHTVVKTERNKILNIGWVGDFGNGNKICEGFSYKKSIHEILFPQLKKIKYNLKLTLIGVKRKEDIPHVHAYFKDSTNIKIHILENLDWENDGWVYHEIKKFDIGVAPMTNHIFNQSKSAFKAKQYLSVGVPTIASNVGENNKFVLNNINGYICKDDDFLVQINKINNLSDKNYFALSKNAIKYKHTYSVKKYCDLLLKAYKNSDE